MAGVEGVPVDRNGEGRSKRPINWDRRAQRRWPHAEWIDDNGPFAVLAHCRVLTIELFETLKEAEERKAFIDRTACGGRCCRDHEIVDLRKRRNRKTEVEREEFRVHRRFWMGE